jgi:hypothetical protein
MSSFVLALRRGGRGECAEGGEEVEHCGGYRARGQHSLQDVVHQLVLAAQLVHLNERQRQATTTRHWVGGREMWGE